MIESELINPEAAEYLNQIEAEKAQVDQIAARKSAMDDLLSYCDEWLERAKQFRANSYEQDWIEFQRNADSKFDPELAKKKKAWQSKAFVDITPSHRENIHARLYKLLASSKPLLEIDALSGGDPIQAENVRDLILREMDKSKFIVDEDKVEEDADTFGFGIARLRWEEKYEDRVIRTPTLEPRTFPNGLPNPGAIYRHMAGQAAVVGYEESVQPVLIYRGTRFEHISIWDFFWDPKATEIKGSTVAVRFKLSKGEIEAGVEQGYYLPEAAQILMDERPDDNEPEDKAQSLAARNISDTGNKKTEYGQEFEAFELHGRLPQKFVFAFTGQQITNPERLIPARIVFVGGKTICAVEINEEYDGEPPYEKRDYMHVNGRFPGRGICEMLRHTQKVVNEVVNQRLDEGNLTLNKKTAVVEKAIVNPKDLEEGAPGAVVRMDNRHLGPTGDVRNAIMQLESSDVHVRAGFSEVTEWERFAQERTSANRVTLGTAGLVQDANQTLGGQELLKESAGDKFSYIAMVQEAGYLQNVFRRYWRLIYKNIQPEDVVNALGLERAQTFVLMSPEEIERDYKYNPQGIFEQENRAVLQARLQAIFQQFATMPWIDPMKFFDQIVKNAGLDPQTLKYSPEEMKQMLIAQATMAQAQAPINEPKPPTPGQEPKEPKS